MATLHSAFPIFFLFLCLACQSLCHSARASWCIAKKGASETQLQFDIDYVCQTVDCGPIEPGGTCFIPNNVVSHASYAVNGYYQTHGRHATDCDFFGSATLTKTDPSYGPCYYPGIKS
ncbi:major pollen allergen Ole e 10-like [Aristolochia californica]|uniref:major pollen allergen Ole e 10-like n=1 Tax=Aristolochia californica TaxID=171875 RepID=UPI0035E0577E